MPFDDDPNPAMAQVIDSGEPMRHPAILHLLRFFDSGHLKPGLQSVVAPFRALAYEVADRAPANPETTVALRKLLEAKDCAVRALI